MGYLLDTHVFLWAAQDSAKLTARVRALFSDASTDMFLSAASVWEIAIKASVGKLVLPMPLEQIVRSGVERGIALLDINSNHAFLVEHLPYHHRDPFDRLLIAQSTYEGLELISADEILDAYSVNRVWA